MNIYCIISNHRGYEITITKDGCVHAAGRTHNTPWSAIVYIDELLQP